MGNERLSVLIFLGLTAYMTMRGLLALVRVNLFDPTSIDLAGGGVADQGIDTLIAAALGVENAATMGWIVTLGIGGGLVVWAFASGSFRRSLDNIVAGVVIGLVIPAGWYVTGVLGFDDFGPVRLESYTFIAPTGESLMYLMTFTGSTIDFGIAAVETFTDRGDMIRHIAGGIAMGFGGVLALGCTIGQGITGMSTLALGSLLSLISIIAGSVVTMKIQYRNL